MEGLVLRPMLLLAGSVAVVCRLGDTLVAQCAPQAALLFGEASLARGARRQPALPPVLILYKE